MLVTICSIPSRFSGGRAMSLSAQITSVGIDSGGSAGGARSAAATAAAGGTAAAGTEGLLAGLSSTGWGIIIAAVGGKKVEDLRESNWGNWRHTITHYLAGTTLRRVLAESLA